MRKLIILTCLALVGAVAADVAPLEPAFTYEYEITELEPIYAVIEMHSGSYGGYSFALEDMFDDLAADAVAPVGPPFGVYYDDPAFTPEDELEWLVGIPVEEGVAAPAGYETQWLEGGTVVKTTLYGEVDFENTTVYDEIYEYIVANGYMPAGPMVEVYRWDSDIDPEDYETDIIVFVEKAGAVGGPGR
jgi:DNA gyrase inhibitor GyrI